MLPAITTPPCAVLACRCRNRGRSRQKNELNAESRAAIKTLCEKKMSKSNDVITDIEQYYYIFATNYKSHVGSKSCFTIYYAPDRNFVSFSSRPVFHNNHNYNCNSNNNNIIIISCLVHITICQTTRGMAYI